MSLRTISAVVILSEHSESKDLGTDSTAKVNQMRRFLENACHREPSRRMVWRSPSKAHVIANQPAGWCGNLQRKSMSLRASSQTGVVTKGNPFRGNPQRFPECPGDRHVGLYGLLAMTAFALLPGRHRRSPRLYSRHPHCISV